MKPRIKPSIPVVSKYAPLPGFGSNPRWSQLARMMLNYGIKAEIVTSDANHGSSILIHKEPFRVFMKDNIKYTILKTRQYARSASIARVISWFDFDYRLFRHCRQMTPDVVAISSLSLTSIIFGIYLKRRYGSRLVFEVRDIWPLTMVEEGGFSKWHPLVLYLRFIELWGYRRAD